MIEFSVSIYPSVSKRGQFAISLTNKGEESIVVGYTADVKKTKEEIIKVVNTDAVWEEDPAIGYHTLQIVHKHDSRCERLT